MFEYFWLPCMVTVAAVALSAILFIEFLKQKRAGQIAVEGRADSDSAPNKGTAESAAPTSTSPSLNETATSSGYDYEVFLSFRGPDTRAGFTDFLYTSLVDAGIRAFKDDEDLRVGEEFASELLQAIKQSKISIPIFSKGYASSVWCLKELAQMVECKKTGGQKIMPIFYDVAPSEVRHQIGGYGEAFRSHVNKKRYDEETMREWKVALEEVSFLNGWDLHSMPNRQEGEFARKLTQKVFSELKKAYLVLSDCLVSVDNHVDVIMEMIGAGTNETRIIGIHGMGGIGKTTVAKMIYNKLANDFENCCFLHDIRERSKGNGIQCLQNQLISDILKLKFVDIEGIDEATQTIKNRLFNKRVLLLLDDVEEENHIHPLVGKRDWLGKGSKIIITTRNKDILEVPEVDCSYELSCMDRDQSLQLFSKHAFRRDYPLDEYIDQSTRVIAIASGLPLTLEVIGSLLCRTNKEKWDLTLKKLENVPHATVQSKLRISYDALDIRQQDIFLDIACLFIGYHKDIVVYLWDESKYPEDAMEVLQNMSLIKITKDNQVWMHDQLRDLGREIVRQKSEMKIEKQSRVWDPTEGSDLLGKHKGNKEVETLRLTLDHQWQHRFTYEGFENLSNLRYLEVNSLEEDFCAEERLLWKESPSNVLPTNENSDLLPRLRWLSWHNIPPTFKIKNFSMENVVFLDLSCSEITHDWKGWDHMKVMKNLKVLNLSYCDYLERTPIFSAQANLERLILQWCCKLVEIDGSICQLKRLVSLDVRGCAKLQRLPDELGNLESLIELNIRFTEIEELSDSIGNLKNLKMLEMSFTTVSKIPDALWTVEKLDKIDISSRNPGDSPVNIGNSIYRNQSLKILRLRYFQIYAVPKLPESLIQLELHKLHMKMFPDLSYLVNLKELELRLAQPDDDVKSNGLVEDSIPRWIGSLTKLESLRLGSPYVTALPVDLSLPPQLKLLHLMYPKLRRLSRLPSSLSSLYLSNCKSLHSIGALSNLENLSSLQIDHAAISEIQGLDCLENLQALVLTYLQQVEKLPDLSDLNKLTSLQVHHCDNLVEIQGDLPQSLEKLQISYCRFLWKLPNLSSLTRLLEVSISRCGNLVEIQLQGELPQSLVELRIDSWKSLWKLPNLSSLMGLREVSIGGCGNLVEIHGELPQSLKTLKIKTWRSLRKFPNLSSLTGLREVSIGFCGNLVEIPGELPQSLTKLKINFCESLRKLPNLSSLKVLREVSIGCCGNLLEIQGELPKSLKKLKIKSLRSFRKFPNLSSLTGLQEISIGSCDNLVEIQGELPQSLEILKIDSCESLRMLPNLSSLTGLQEVSISCCGNLVEIHGELPQSLKKLEIDFWRSLWKLPNLSSLTGLREVYIGFCGNLVEIQGVLPQSLKKLQIESCESLRKLPNLSSLTGLRNLYIGCCGNLVEIPGELPQSLETLEIDSWRSLRKFPNLSSLMGLREVSIVGCDNLVEIQGELPQSLKTLTIYSCESLRKLPNLSSLMGLRKVSIGLCGNLVNIQGELPQSLKTLKIHSCGSLRKLPNLSSLMGLGKVSIVGCDNLVKIQGELPQSLEILKIYFCESLRKLPDLSNLIGQGKFQIIGCGKLNLGEDNESESQSEGEDHESEYDI